MDDAARIAVDVARQCEHGPMVGAPPSRQPSDFACTVCITAALHEAALAEAAKHADCCVDREELHQFYNLLAIIHRDGGHYRERHGSSKASDDAQEIVCDLRMKLDQCRHDWYQTTLALDQSQARLARVESELWLINDRRILDRFRAALAPDAATEGTDG